MKQGSEGGDTVISVPLLVGKDDTKPEAADLRHSVSGSTSVFKTCFNCLNALSGVGILSVPYALASGGWLSLSLLFLMASSTYYTGILIKRCMDTDENIRTYPDIGSRAFGSIGRTLVSVAMNIELYLVAVSFLIVEGDNLYSLFSHMEHNVCGLVVGGRQSFILLVGVVLLPTVWLNNMTILSYISASGVIASFILLGSIVWNGVFDGVGFHEKGTIVNWKGIPTAVSLYAFCYCAHPVFPTLYSSMTNQKKFSKVLFVCFLVCTATYASMAILGYLMFGSEVLSQITLNLDTDNLSSRIAIFTTLVNPLAKYALMISPIVSVLENRLLSHPSKGLSMLIRTGFVLSTIMVALAIPFFEYLMSLVGAFLSVTASIILPCACFLKISGTYRRRGYELLFVSGIMVVGVMVLVVGTYTALRETIEHLLR